MQRQKTDGLEHEILALEMRFWDAVQSRDSETAASLSDDPCIVVGSHGVGEIGHETFSQLMKQDKWTIAGYTLKDVHVRQISEDVVAVAYTVEEEGRLEGKDLKLKAYDCSVWKKVGDRWICVVHTETPHGDPLGAH
ncbi:nuclear transport factor 2 family protein [Ideonella sp. YS5]|uniref:nuclear transport factor 2 family protein n=1 Tax=Ideonella sp. YS5 TaxID=3453714 RepID=UPI003EE9CA0B